MKKKELFEKKEAMRYVFWGVVTVGVNYLSYLLLQLFMPYQAANLISIVMTKVFAYCTNRKFVFRSQSGSREQVKEIIRYILSRGLTGVVDFFGLILLTETILPDDRIGKIVMIGVTTVMNYFLGKIFVFKSSERD